VLNDVGKLIYVLLPYESDDKKFQTTILQITNKFQYSISQYSNTGQTVLQVVTIQIVLDLLLLKLK